jgi:hypothetical protein
MRRFAVVFCLILLCASPAYAINPVDAMLCKRVVLEYNDRTILVNRFTGEVKYILKNDEHWVLLRGEKKSEFQAIYDAQVEREKPR